MKDAKTGPGAAEHYVMTVPVGTVRLHCYLMTTRRSHVSRASNDLLDRAEQLCQVVGVGLLPLILITGPLDPEATQRVRSALREADVEVARRMAEATNIHRTIFVTEPGARFDKLIMDLH